MVNEVIDRFRYGSQVMILHIFSNTHLQLLTVPKLCILLQTLQADPQQ